LSTVDAAVHLYSATDRYALTQVFNQLLAIQCNIKY